MEGGGWGGRGGEGRMLDPKKGVRNTQVTIRNTQVTIRNTQVAKKGSATIKQFENIFSTLNGQSLSFDKYMKIGKKPIIESELCKKCIVLN